MNTKKRNRAAVIFGLLLLAALVVALVLALICGSANRTAGSGHGTGQLAQSIDSFSITGDVSAPIVPGSRVPLDLTIANEHAAAMVVTQLKVLVTRVEAPRADASHPCSVDDFAIEQVDSKLSVIVSPATSQSLSQLGIPDSAWPSLGMRETSVNQDGCKGASLTLSYSAVGRVETK